MTRLDTRVSQTVSHSQGTATLHPVINPDGSTGGWADARTQFKGETYISPAVTLVGPMTVANCTLGDKDSTEPMTIIVTKESTLENVIWNGLHEVNLTAGLMNLKDVHFFGQAELSSDYTFLSLRKSTLGDVVITTIKPINITASNLNHINLKSQGEVIISASHLRYGVYQDLEGLSIYNTRFEGVNIDTQEAKTPTVFTNQTCRRDLMWAIEELTLTEHDVLVHHRTPFFKRNLSNLINRATGTITFLSEIDLWSLEDFVAEVEGRELSIENHEVTNEEYAYIDTIINQAKLSTQL